MQRKQDSIDAAFLYRCGNVPWQCHGHDARESKQRNRKLGRRDTRAYNSQNSR